MSNLYNSLSVIYDGMYQTFIDYEDEFRFYSEILLRYECESVVEIGCGTGKLAGRFSDRGFTYTGMDLSDEMLEIARRNYPDSQFTKGDMRNFQMQVKSDSCVITGRSISYLITNNDVSETFDAIYKNLDACGIVCFDSIDAAKFIPSIKEGESVVHKASFNNTKYHRDSYWKINPDQSWTFDWLSVYFEDQGGKLVKIGEDQSTIRAFTKDDMTMFLKIAGFSIREIIDRPSYAFDTFVIVAQKSR